MTHELSNSLIERFPEYFNRATPPIQGGFYGFECGDGWFSLLEDLLSKIYKEGLGLVKVLQVKEKFGGLRFYFKREGADSSRLEELVAEAEVKANHTCETCGKEGSLRSGGWMKTLCDKHDAERDSFWKK